MLNINPVNNYNKPNINFKSQKDFSKIYKQMEKIALTQEETIKPKILMGENFETLKNGIKKGSKFKLTSITDVLRDIADIIYCDCGIKKSLNFLIELIKNVWNHIDGFVYFIKWPVILGVSSSAILAFLEKQCEKSSHADKTKSEEKIVNKTDSLYNLYKNNTITFDKFQEELDKLNKNK